jgi:hypothetical protein
MNLEEFLTDTTNSLDTYTELTWNIINAHELMTRACHITKKESYVALLKELDELVEKYNLHVEPIEFNEDQTILEQADKLISRDPTTRYYGL